MAEIGVYSLSEEGDMVELPGDDEEMIDVYASQAM